ncbi:MAG: hypothetical protein R2729_18745 [Bryobacteraceae bacterium]
MDPALFLTWRLHGTLPPPEPPTPRAVTGRQFVAVDRLLDRAVHGPTWLGMPEIAELVAGSLQTHARVHGHFDLHAWAILPNHVHALLTPRSHRAAAWIEDSGRLALRALGLRGCPFWHREPIGRTVESEREAARIAHYIECNPVSAGLAAAPEHFLWSSAAARP